YNMDQGDEGRNLWVKITSENVAVTFDGTTGYVVGSTIERSVTTVAPERVHSVQDTGGYLPGPMPYNGGFKIEEVYDDASFECQLVATNHAKRGRATRSRSSSFKERYRSLLVAIEELRACLVQGNKIKEMEINQFLMFGAV
ncbi:hypothetical protein Tco_1342297, partial [Tanacetum coccineum]